MEFVLAVGCAAQAQAAASMRCRGHLEVETYRNGWKIYPAYLFADPFWRVWQRWAAMPENAADIYSPGYDRLNDGPFVSGFYVGINGGGSFGASESSVLTNDQDPSQAAIGQFYRHSGFGGGQAG